MPFDHGLGFDNDQRGFPIGPDSRQPSPEEPVSVLQLRPLDGPLLNQELLAQSQIFQDQVPPTTKHSTKHEKEHSENIHIGRPTPTPVSFTMALREPAILRKLLRINKDGVFGTDRRIYIDDIRLTKRMP